MSLASSILEWWFLTVNLEFWLEASLERFKRFFRPMSIDIFDSERLQNVYQVSVSLRNLQQILMDRSLHSEFWRLKTLLATSAIIIG